MEDIQSKYKLDIDDIHNTNNIIEYQLLRNFVQHSKVLSSLSLPIVTDQI